MAKVLEISPLVIFAVLGFQLARIDFKQKILPNELVAKLSVFVLGTCFAYSALLGDWAKLRSGIWFGFSYLAVFLGLFFLSRGQLGFGDVKFSFVCGLTLGWTANQYLFESLFLAFGGAGIVSILLLATQKIRLKSQIAFGPFMYFGVIFSSLIAIFSG